MHLFSSFVLLIHVLLLQEDPELSMDSLEDLHFPWLPHQLQISFKVKYLSHLFTSPPPLLPPPSPHLNLCFLLLLVMSCLVALPLFFILSHLCVHWTIFWKRWTWKKIFFLLAQPQGCLQISLLSYQLQEHDGKYALSVYFCMCTMYVILSI